MSLCGTCNLILKDKHQIRTDQPSFLNGKFPGQSSLFWAHWIKALIRIIGLESWPHFSPTVRGRHGLSESWWLTYEICFTAQLNQYLLASRTTVCCEILQCACYVTYLTSLIPATSSNLTNCYYEYLHKELPNRDLLKRKTNINTHFFASKPHILWYSIF